MQFKERMLLTQTDGTYQLVVSLWTGTICGSKILACPRTQILNLILQII